MKISVNGASYQFPEIDTITFREASIVKKLTGLRLGEFSEAFEQGDTDMMLGLAAIAVHRHSGQTEFDYLYDLNLDLIQFEVEESDTELPPADRPVSDANGGSSDGPTPESDESGVPASSDTTESNPGISKTSPPTKSKHSKTTSGEEPAVAERKLVVEVVGDTAAYERAMKKAAAQSNQFTTQLQKSNSQLSTFAKRAALTAGAAGLGALAIGTKKSIDAAKNLGESINAVEVVFGSASKQVLAFSEGAAKKAGLSMRELNELVTPIGAALQNVGLSADEAATASVNLAQRAADMASVFNVEVGQALGAIQAGLRGEADPLERFGVGLNAAAVTAEAMALGLAKTETAISANDKAQARLSLIMKQTNKLQGDFANTSDGAANKQRILSAEIENLEAKLGQKLLPVVGVVLDKLLEWTTKLEKNEQLQKDVENAIRDVIEVAQTMAETADDVAKALGGWDDAIKIAAGAIVLAKLGALDLALGGILGKGGKDNPKGVLGIASVFRLVWPIAIAAGVGAAIKNLTPIESWVDRLTAKIGNIGGELESGTGGITLIGPDGKPVGNVPGGTTGKGVTTAKGLLTGQTGRGLQLPTSIKTTHPTSGLAGFPAVDIFARPGTRVRAPEDGFITRISGSATTTGGTYGWAVYFLGSKTGNTYFIKHLASTAAPGRYKKGDVIGTVSAWSGGSSHVHLGIHAGTSPVAKSGGGGGDDPDTTKTTTTNFQAIPISLRTALAEAQVKGSGEEGVLRRIRANLQAQLKTVTGENRLEVLNALKSVNADIKAIADKHAQAIEDREEKHIEALKKKAAKKREAMLSAFKGVAAAALKEFDKATAAGLGIFDELTPAEKELADFRKRRTDEERNQRRVQAAGIEDPFERAEALRRLDLEDQESALEERARLEREARDKEKEAYLEKREEDKTRLETWLDQQEKALSDGRKSWEKFYKDLRAIAIRYGFPVGPIGRAPSATPQAAAAATSGILPGIGSAAGGHVLDVGPDAGSGATVIVNVAGSVTTEQDLARTVRDVLVRDGRNNGGGMFGNQA